MRSEPIEYVLISALLGAGACTGTTEPLPEDGDTTASSDTGSLPGDSGESDPDSDTSDSESDSDTSDTSDSEGEPACVPPPRLSLADIPDRASLAEVNEDTLAAFEVDGDALVGKFVRDPDAAEGALDLWQELVLRIPTNQRLDLVQLNIFGDTDPVAWVDGSGVGNQVGRYGFTVAFSAENFSLNPDDPCAPLSGHRGTFDWTLIHEFHHIRGRADGTIDGFTAQFPHEVGDGEGYPEDGTPALDRDYVSSYAERSSGDEDAAETFTAYIMLDELPELTSALATAKIRWFAEQTDYSALRQAIRISEDEGPPPELAPAPRAVFPFDLDPPAWIWGTWSGVTGSGMEVRFTFEESNVTYAQLVDGVETSVSSYANLRDDGTLATITEHVASDNEYSYTKLVGGQGGGTETFSRMTDSSLLVSFESLGDDGQFELVRATE